MLTNLDPQSALFLSEVDRVQNRIATANNQVTSGLKITAAADAPDQISTLLQLRAIKQHNAQIQANLTLAQGDANSADSALSSSIQLMDTALSLATQGATDTSDASTRSNLAQQIRTMEQQMVSNTQTTVQGRYIFSGDSDNAPQYTWDSPTNSLVPGTLAQSTRLIENPAGGTFPASMTAQQIFDDTDPVTGQPAADNVFNALATLAQALQANDTTGIANSITLLKAASNHLNVAQSFYGNIQESLQSAADYATKYDVQLETQISQIQDADVAGAAIELTQANTQLQAAFQMQAQMPHSSLFNYLG